MSDTVKATRTRTRTITWEDPHALAEAGRGLSGLEYLRKIVAGELPPPPIAALMNFNITELSEGRAVFVVEPAEYHYNPIGVVHGGLAAMLLDSAMGCAVHSTLPAGAGYTTLEIKVNYIRPMTAETGRVSCEAKVVHVGGRTATASGRIEDEGGKLYAHGTTTCIIFHSQNEASIIRRLSDHEN
ncbi:MAG TPA: PaaI family thioesterase [Pyrinomonadaceae bacterium]